MSDAPMLVTCEVQAEGPFCGALVDQLRATAKQWADLAACFGQSPIRAHSIGYEVVGNMLSVTTRTTISTATPAGREVVAGLRKAGFKIVSEEPIT